MLSASRDGREAWAIQTRGSTIISTYRILAANGDDVGSDLLLRTRRCTRCDDGMMGYDEDHDRCMSKLEDYIDADRRATMSSY